MKITFKDAMTFLNNDVDPTVGSISYDNSELFNADTPVTIETGSKKITVLAKQIELAIFKLDRKHWGFIFKNNLCHTDANDKEDFERSTEGRKNTFLFKHGVLPRLFFLIYQKGKSLR